MSRLRELRLHGFKTFADPTRFVFERGVNAIIGPNGSGKSNMADAVRWVLGEQSNRSLRTRRADDVIFAGSEQRKPQGMAEAILTLDNADGWLPIEFAEVSIGRRAYRSGETEYLVNGARARLRDIVDLLGEGRLGANELVVVGQGTVDAALSLRPEERRQLFEEAAGVKNLQVRKNEALARLGRARDNLTRVTDLIGELKPQVRRLALQAQHQQEHDALGRRARALVVESHRRRESAARDRLGEARRAAAAAEEALEAHRTAQSVAREAIAEAEERYWAAEAAARVATERREETREARVRAEGRVEALSARLAVLKREREASAQELEAARVALADHASGRVEGDVAPATTRAAEAEALWREASDALAAADADVLAAEEALADARRLEGERIARTARLGEITARAAARREQVDRELAEATGRLAEAEGDVAPARAAAEDAAARLEAARASHEKALAELVEAQPRADAARRQASELAERVGAMRGELEALHERAERGSRLGSLLSAAGWPALLDTLAPPEDAWPAIEAVVGGELEHALLWRDDSPVERLVEARGSARLLAAAGGAPDQEGDRPAALAAVGATRTLADWLSGMATPRLFHRVAVAPDLRALLRGWHQLPPGWLGVTPQGDMADGRGLVAVRGRDEAPAGESARRHARRRELVEALEHLEDEQSTTAATAAHLMATVGEIGRRLEAARAARDEAERQAAAARAGLQSAEDRLARQRSRVAELYGEQERLPAGGPATPGASEATAATAADAAPRALADLERRALDARQARQAAAQRRDEARDAWQSAQVDARHIEERHVGTEREVAVLTVRVAQLEAAIPAAARSIDELTAEHAAAESQRVEAQAADDAAAEARRDADAAREGGRAALLELERQAGAPGQVAELERAAQAAAVELSRHEEALASLARERELALETLPDEVAGGPEEADGERALPAELTGLDDEAMEAELRRVRRTLAQIGSVNPFAVEEHRELAARLEELSNQDADLSGAIGSTAELIARLDAEISEQFNLAFAAIGERFDEFCRLLFAGGSASLQLSDGTDGEAPGGIEIVVRPPGKRLQRLAMLSGGERALTGVALLFAMLSVNPVPFCILDEVDAALDEANIGRFADALRKLSESIDFVVITHNRATIEVADTIYGVTMTDSAVSRVVSLRLADIPVEAPVG